MCLDHELRTERECLPPRTVILTIDDGPSMSWSPDIPDTSTIDIARFLFQRNISATFFMVGKSVQANLDVVKQVIDYGHVIGNHTFSHLPLPRLSDFEIIQEIELGLEQLRLAGYTGLVPFRPPFGLWDERCRHLVREVPSLSSAHEGVFGWDFGSKYPDWRAWERSIPVQLQYALTTREIRKSNYRGTLLLHDARANSPYVENRNKAFQLIQKIVNWARKGDVRLVST